MTDKMIVFDDGFVYRRLSPSQAALLIGNGITVMAIGWASQTEFALSDVDALAGAIDGCYDVGIDVGFIDDFVKRKNETTVLINGSIYKKKVMKKISKWYKKLPEPERSEALSNVHYSTSQNKVKSMHDALSIGFPWYESPQGRHYWEAIANSYEKD